MSQRGAYLERQKLAGKLFLHTAIPGAASSPVNIHSNLVPSVPFTWPAHLQSLTLITCLSLGHCCHHSLPLYIYSPVSLVPSPCLSSNLMSSSNQLPAICSKATPGLTLCLPVTPFWRGASSKLLLATT
ncbi:hypothetical protein CRENBAI_011039 [Crenichthys baileyi]|uniref:Uncharacterized protein n=1 Tax=Crenichthys baileyi TaxID=28760 RepID=A0AAV9RME8_9TELE